MWAQWQLTFPDIALLPLDVGTGKPVQLQQVPLPRLALWLLPPEERTLHAALSALVGVRTAECGVLCEHALGSGQSHPDFYLLAGACALAEGRVAAAVDLLANAYLYREGMEGHPPVGVATRHLLPTLRLQVRITPTQLMPIYPSPYGASLLYAVALEAAGQSEQALMILREMVPQYGMHDELLVLAARIHTGLGNFDTALGALTYDEPQQRDALEYTRCLYLAWCLREAGQSRRAAQELGRAVRTIAAVNEHTRARAAVLLSQLFADCGLMLDSLRESGAVDPALLPPAVAREVLRQEEQLLHRLEALNPLELELLAEADPFQVYLPDRPAAKQLSDKLAIGRDPQKAASTDLSWAKQREQDRVQTVVAAAVAKGEAPPITFPARLSAAAADVRKRINKAHEWWRERCPALLGANGSPQLALTDWASAPHLRFDFCGDREREPTPWLGELRARQAVAWAGIVAAIIIGLFLVRYFFAI